MYLYACIFSCDFHFWNTVSMSDGISFSWTGKGIFIHRAASESVSVDTTCDHTSEIYGCFGNLYCGTDCRFYICDHDRNIVRSYNEKGFA